MARSDYATDNRANFPNIITCPSELVALSAALGYAQVTGIPVRGLYPSLVFNLANWLLAMRSRARRLRYPGHGAVNSQCFDWQSTRSVFCGSQSLHSERGITRIKNRVRICAKFSADEAHPSQVHSLAARCSRSSSNSPAVLQVLWRGQKRA